jgi:hypothetical protein
MPFRTKMTRPLFQTERNAIAVVILFAFIGCGAALAQETRSISIVGLWEEEGPTVHAVSLRKADGTYRRKVVQVYDYARPPIVYREDGHWRINGKRYLFTVDHITAARWKRDIGTQRNLKILATNTMLFRYVSTDGAVVEERRIGEASDVMFDSIRLGEKLRKRKAEKRADEVGANY